MEMFAASALPLRKPIVNRPAMTVKQAARYQAITDLLAADGRVDVVDIANRLGVAQETIRRDLRAMETAGNCSECTAARFGSLPVRCILLNNQPAVAQMILS